MNITYYVHGDPVPKQSFRYAKTGGYTSPRVAAWQRLVADTARVQMQDEPTSGHVAVWLDFYLRGERRQDIDNLSKGVLDSMNGIVYVDEKQVVELHLHKVLRSQIPGVSVRVREVE